MIQDGLDAILSFLPTSVQDLLLDTNSFILIAAFIVPILLLRYSWRRNQDTRKLVNPLVIFFKQLTNGASPTYDKILFRMLHPNVLKLVDRALVRAMAKCIIARYGDFIELDADVVEVRKSRKQTHARVTANFSKAKRVVCEASWVVDEKVPFLVTEFKVVPRPDESSELDVISYIDPSELEGFGQKFIENLFKKDCTAALDVMYESLRKRYDSPDALTEEIKKVLRACGGLKFQHGIDMTLTESSVAKGGENGNKTSGVELSFIILGLTRDIKAQIKIVFHNLQSKVIRYSLTALAPNTKHMFVDGDTGEKQVL